MGSPSAIEWTQLTSHLARPGRKPREPVARTADGKECRTCGEHKPFEAFTIDRSRFDGRTYHCSECRAAKAKASYKPSAKPKPEPGRRFVPARDGDKLQARRRIDHLVNVGLLPKANSVPCTDCGHSYVEGGRRHEYDHHLGYSPEHHQSVQAVCTTCHHQREQVRELEVSRG